MTTATIRTAQKLTHLHRVAAAVTGYNSRITAAIRRRYQAVMFTMSAAEYDTFSRWYWEG